MGYTTNFRGELKLSRPLNETEKNYINTFSETRRMKRDVNKLMEIYKGKHGYPYPYLLSGQIMNNTPETIYGHEGEYFAYDDGNCGQTHDDSIIDYNIPAGQVGFDVNLNTFTERWAENEKRIKEGNCQPGLWCQWVIREVEDKKQILEWDGGEKFYNYVEWLKYLINHFFEVWGVKLNGEIKWEGEDSNDMGLIIVTDNIVKVKIAKITFEDEE